MTSTKVILWTLLFLLVGVLMPHGSSGQGEAPKIPVTQPEEAGQPAVQTSENDAANEPKESAPIPVPVQIQNPAPLPTAAKNPLPNGEITEHRSPDGSIITVSRFNGQIPDHLLQPHLAGSWNAFEHQRQLFRAQRVQQEAFMREMYQLNNAMFSSSFAQFYQPYQDMSRIFYNNMQDMQNQGMFHPWNWNNQYLMGPFGWPYGPPRVQEGPFPSPSQAQSKPGSKKKRSIDYASTPLGPTQTRTSNSFHYPALPNEYWSTHKKPDVPLVDVDNTKLDHIYEKSKPKQ